MEVYNTPNFIKKNISIILQGAVTKKNIFQIASHCAHWRNILPNAEIILSISTTDCLYFKRKIFRNKLIKNITNSPRSDYTILTAINTLKENCDYFLFDEKSTALPLPPIKDDTHHPNNINFLVESSRNGLSVASKLYTLRIRNDAIFLNSNFIHLYCDGYILPRKQETSFFQQRVLVPWIYTLNPYSDERLPLHISDWLNFGLTEDIKKIWDIPPYTLQDAVFFEKNKPEDTNLPERHFNLRLAVEQYIYIHFFQKVCPRIKISYLNDLSSLEMCMDITLDNFFVFSRKEFCLRISKHYQEDLTNPYKRSACLTEDAWLFMVMNRAIPFRKVLYGNVDDNIRKLSRNTFYIEEFKAEYSNLHNNLDLFQKIIFSIYTRILTKKRRNKFLYHPKDFFCDSKSFITRTIHKFYIK